MFDSREPFVGELFPLRNSFFGVAAHIEIRSSALLYEHFDGPGVDQLNDQSQGKRRGCTGLAVDLRNIKYHISDWSVAVDVQINQIVQILPGGVPVGAIRFHVLRKRSGADSDAANLAFPALQRAVYGRRVDTIDIDYQHQIIRFHLIVVKGFGNYSG